MNAIKRIFKNLKWLFNHPCIGLTDTKPEDMKHCDYCGQPANFQTYYPKFNICYACVKKSFDKILKEKL